MAKSYSSSGYASYSSPYEDLISKHLDRISNTASQDVIFGSESMRLAARLRSQVKMFETFLRPYLAGTDYFSRKDKLIKLYPEKIANYPTGYVNYMNRLSDWLGLLMLYAYNSSVIRANIKNRRDIEKLRADEEEERNYESYSGSDSDS